MARIQSLDAVRGLLALWVVVGHALTYIGFTHQHLWPLGFLGRPGLAVDDFVILSGFVIFYLLDHERMSYGRFLLRRFLRLAPMFFFVLAISAATINYQIDALQALPWPSAEVTSDLALHQRALDYFVPHLIAHVTMLHGLLSNDILPGSSYIFILQAWSISVEWQFYIVAPVLFWLIAQRRWTLVMATIAAMCILRWVNYGGDGFAPNRAIYFIIGIASYYGYRWMSTQRIQNHGVIDVATVAVVAGLYMLQAEPMALIIWTVVFGVLIAEQQGSMTLPQRLARTFLHHPVLLWLGKISYSVYLVHLLLFYALAAIVLRLWPELGQAEFALIAIPALVVLTIAVSAVTFNWIEKPGMKLGRNLSREQQAQRFAEAEQPVPLPPR